MAFDFGSVLGGLRDIGGAFIDWTGREDKQGISNAQRLFDIGSVLSQYSTQRLQPEQQMMGQPLGFTNFLTQGRPQIGYGNQTGDLDFRNLLANLFGRGTPKPGMIEQDYGYMTPRPDYTSYLSAFGRTPGI
jgi:hypothetical protein